MYLKYFFFHKTISPIKINFQNIFYHGNRLFSTEKTPQPSRVSDPIIRNAQEKRQLATIEKYLKDKGYSPAEANIKFNEMLPGTYSFRTNVQVRIGNDSEQTANLPVDVRISPISAQKGDLPIMVEAKSAGDYTNVNKRCKEEATKMQQLRNTFGNNVTFVLFLCGYFDSAYLRYEAAEGIDWIWEHRITDKDSFTISFNCRSLCSNSVSSKSSFFWSKKSTNPCNKKEVWLLLRKKAPTSSECSPSYFFWSLTIATIFIAGNTIGFIPG